MKTKKHLFLVFDTESSMYFGKGGKQTPSIQDARQYKRKHAAIELASLHNVSRNIPAGIKQHKNYNNRPQVVVLELDCDQSNGRIKAATIVATHSAPPSYIRI